MKNSTFITIATAAAASAQVTYNNGTYTCAQPNVAYCAGTSLQSDIIIRCNAQGVGQPGRCTDNLAGQPPLGVQPALCYQSSPTAGDAACEKNCIVYGSSGGSSNTGGTTSLPASLCTPYTTVASSTATGTSTITSTGTGSSTIVTTTTSTYNTTICPSSSTTSTYSTLPTSYPNTTMTSQTSTTSQTTGPATVTSTTTTGTGTTTSRPTQVTAGAAINAVGSGALAVMGLAAAYLL